MSDNVIRPEQWLRNGEASLEAQADGSAALDDRLGGGGDGPHDPGMEQRVTTLEADMKDVKGSLNRIETTLAVMSETMKGLATKTEMMAVTGSVNALTERVKAVEDRSTRLESSVSGALATAVGKAIGPGQLFGILAGMVGCVAAAAGFVAWLIRQPWFAAH